MIFTERTITVVNDSATINKPLILYRGDKNIELKITIAESQFKFRNTDASNVIETTDASYAQLVINTPYNSPIFSDVAVTKNGAVIFVITEAMIDEIREVGVYEIQIRLLDDNKQSRASIPPVSNAIEIREPIAIEDGSAVDSNTVNVAKVNRALTTTSAPLEAFDSQGNYIKKTWGDGDTITDAALNKMEAGIEGVNKKIANLVLGADGNNAEVVQARGSYDVLNDRLNVYDDIINLNSVKIKLNQNAILQNCIKTDGVITPVSNGFALTYYDVTNLEYIYINGELDVPNVNYCDYLFKDVNGNVLKYKTKSDNASINTLMKVPAGATILYLGTGMSNYTDMCVYSINNMENIIKDLNINALEKMNNETLEVFNKSSYMEKMTPTIYNQQCVKPDGTIVPVTPTYTSLEFNIQNEKYIYVKNLEVARPNSNYCVYCILDKNNKVLKVCEEDGQTLNKLIPLPPHSSKIRFTCLASSYADGEVSVYVNIKEVIDDKASYEYVDNSINKLDKLYEVDNLFNKNSDEVIKGYTLGSDGNKYENSSMFITNFIPVTVDDTLYGCFIDGAYFVCYDAYKTRIGYGYINSNSDGVKLANLTTVSQEQLPTIAYIRFANQLSLIDSMTVTKTCSYRSREHKVLPIKNLKEANNGMINFWEGKIGDSLGDSLTGQGFFQRYTSMYFNLQKFANHGVGGSKLSGEDVDSSRPSMWQDSRINDLRDDADFITILGGQNDGNVEIGEISKTNMNTNTYVGAYNTIIDKIYKKYNGNIKIILCTPFYVPAGGDNNERFIEFDKAVIEIGRLHGLPVADFGGNCGANKYTKDLYWGEDKTHPIEDFYRDRITPILIDTMKKIEPIDYTKCNCIAYPVSQ